MTSRGEHMKSIVFNGLGASNYSIIIDEFLFFLLTKDLSLLKYLVELIIILQLKIMVTKINQL